MGEWLWLVGWKREKRAARVAVRAHEQRDAVHMIVAEKGCRQ